VSGAAVALVAAAPTAAQAANPCRTASAARGNQILIASNAAVVFSSRRLKQHVACTYRHKRRVKLGRIACCSELRYALGGRYLAYVYRLDEAFNEVDELGVVDLKTGKRLRYGGKTRVDTNGYVNGFFVTPRGSLAWLQYGLDERGEREADRTVRAAVRNGPIEDLDVGPIAFGSLALGSGGKALYWTKGGVTQSAVLK
jgi:hypothetical protein